MATTTIPSAPKFGIGNPPAAATTAAPTERMPEKWTRDKPLSSQYFYDEPISELLPPDNLNLSDAWVVQVLKSDVKPRDRRDKWPAVFSSKYLKAGYKNKGAASKHQDSNGEWRYDLIFGNYQMHGQEGQNGGKVFDHGYRVSSKRDIEDGELCIVASEETPASTANQELRDAAAGETQETTLFGPSKSLPDQVVLKTLSESVLKQAFQETPISDTYAPNVTTRGSKKRKREEVVNDASDVTPLPEGQNRPVPGPSKVKSGSKPSKPNPKQAAPEFFIPSLADSDEGENENVTTMRALNDELTTLRAENDELRTKFGKSERGMVLLVEALAHVHEMIDPLSRRTGKAAELLKKSIRIMTVTREASQDELEEIKKFYRENAAEVSQLVKNGQEAVQNVHSVLPDLGRIIFFHDQNTKQELADWLKTIRDAHCAEDNDSGNDGHGNADGGNDVGTDDSRSDDIVS